MLKCCTFIQKPVSHLTQLDIECECDIGAKVKTNKNSFSIIKKREEEEEEEVDEERELRALTLRVQSWRHEHGTHNEMKKNANGTRL